MSDEHPHSLLADLADDRLPESNRGEVEAHLATCAACRQDLELARRGRDALRSLPELHAPFGLTRAVLAEAGAGPGRRNLGRIAAAAWRPVAAAAVAAAVIAGFAVLSGRNPAASSGPAGAAGSRPQAGVAAPEPNVAGVPLVISRTDYDPSKVRALAADVATRTNHGTPPRSPAFATAGGRTATETALMCVTRAEVASPSPRSGLTFTVRVVELIQASYRGTPAYLGVFVHSTETGGRVQIWVVARDGCRLLSYVQRPVG